MGGGGGGGFELLISEIKGNLLDYPHQIFSFFKCHAYFLSLLTYRLNIKVSTTQTLSQIESQEFMGHIQKHFITTRFLTYLTNGIQDFVKCCIKSYMHLDLRPANILFGGLHHSAMSSHNCSLKFSSMTPPPPQPPSQEIKDRLEAELKGTVGVFKSIWCSS